MKTVANFGGDVNTTINEWDGKKEKILVYGVGNFFLANEQKINQDFYIEKFVDKYKRGLHAGKEIVNIDEIKGNKFDKILIMLQSVQLCIDTARELLAQNIDYKNIMLGISLYGDYSKSFDSITVMADSKIQLKKDTITILVKSQDEFANVYEVLVNQIYHYYINNEQKDIVFDIGMNVGDASIYFLKNPKIEKVYAYEPFKETYLRAIENLHNNFKSLERIETFQYGISCENAKREINFNDNMTCGQSTLADVRATAYQRYQYIDLVHDEQEKKELIRVRDAAEVFSPIIESHTNCNFILKMDCEGEEYGIMEKLSKERMLEKFSFIMLEWHYKGKEGILTYLRNAGFSYWCNDKEHDMGMVYAYRK